jgi:YVTN family beta-propeller protein
MLAMTAAIGAHQAQAQTLVVLNKSDDNVSLITPATGEAFATISVGEDPHEAATSPDGKTVVVCNYGPRERPGNTLTVIDLPTQTATKTIDLGENRRPHGIIYLDDTTITVTTEGSKKLLLVDIEEGKVTAVETGDGAEGVAAHQTRPEVWVTNRGANTVCVVSTESLEITETFDCGEVPIRATFTPDGAKALISCARSGEVVIFDVASRNEIARVAMEIDESEVTTEGRLFGRTFGNSPVPIGILVDPSGKLAYVANTNADIVTVIDIAQAKVVDRLVAGKEPDGMTWSPLGGS